VSSRIRVRAVAAREWSVWRDLRLRSLADSPDSFGETRAHATSRDEASWIAATAPDRTRIVLIALDGEIAVGTAVGRVNREAEGPQAHLYAMWVAPEARRRGVARALVGAVMRWARMAGARRLVLRVTEPAVAASALYRSMGFAPTGEVEPLRPGSPIESHVLAATLGPLVMGVVNVTPDSFSDGGQFYEPDAAIAHGLSLIAGGADLVDVGGEATNPHAAPVDASEELRRIEPVIRALAGAGVTVSVDTTKAVVAAAAISAGATIVNDVSGGLFDPDMSSILADFDGTYIVGHLRGTCLAEVFATEATVTWREVATELGERLATLPARARAHAWVDPGVGFGKGRDPAGNLALLRHAGDLGRALGCPVVVGPSRKRFVRRIVEAAGGDPTSLEQVDAASIEASLAAVRAGAQVVRVHNVTLLRAVLAVYTRM